MPSWRCPHCSTPQPEASRCWVCHRSSTSCATCRQFRRSVAAGVGFCALDRQRVPLDGDEVRACWEDGAAPVPPDPVIPGLLDLLVDAPAGEANAATSQHQSVGAIVPGDGLRDDRRSAGVGRPGRVWVEVGAEATR